MHSLDLELTLPALFIGKKMKQDFLKRIKENISLEKHTTMRTHGLVKYFFEAQNKDDLIAALIFAKEKNLPFFILGGGSNTISSDYYEGVVIKMAMKEFLINEDKDSLSVLAQAGTSLILFSREITEKKGVGMEWGAGVPGTVGGAIRGNAGAFGNCIADFVTHIGVVDVNTREERVFEKEECLFEYRESIFKKNKNFIVLYAKMIIPKGEGGKERMLEQLSVRRNNHPNLPSAGSIFKNIKGKISDEDVINRYPKIKDFNQYGTIPSRFLIEQCGLKGVRRGGAQISEKHTNFIVNTGGATRSDIEYLVNLVKKRVKEEFGIDMEEEVDLSLK